MKSRHLILILMFAVGCSSGTKKQKSSTRDELGSATSDVEVESSPQMPISERDPSPESEPPVQATTRPETPESLYKALSDSYKSQNDEAISRASIQILSQNPQDLKALNSAGLVHYRKGRFLAARYFLTRALAVSPKSSEVLNNLGLVALSLDEQKEAIRLFRKALDVNPSDAIAAANLGAIYAREKDYTKAQFALEIAVKKGMRETRTLTNYAIALMNSGKPDQAKNIIDEALKMNSSNKEALFVSAVLMIEHMKQYSEGLDQLNRIKFLGPGQDLRNRMNELENKAKAGIK